MLDSGLHHMLDSESGNASGATEEAPILSTAKLFNWIAGKLTAVHTWVGQP